MKLHHLATPLTLLLAASLTACSGSSTSTSNETNDNSSGDNGQTQEPVTVQRVSLTGLAVKGTVIGAKAELFRLSNGSIEASAFATGTTDFEGRYNLTALSEEAYDGPALVKISWQEGAEMICDATSGCGSFNSGDSRDRNTNQTIDFGEAYDLPADFSMTAFIPGIRSSELDERTYTANVSSLTHIAAQYASSQSALDEALIRRLNNRVRVMFGLTEDSLGEADLLLTEPLDPAQDLSGESAAQIAYGLLTAALAELAEQRDVSVAALLNTFAANFAANNGQLRWNNPGSANELNIAEILAAAKAIADQKGGINTVALVDAKTDADNNSGVSAINPPQANAGADQTVSPEAPVTLSGSSDKPDATLTWSQVSGTPVTLSSTSTASPTFTAPKAAGDLVFALKASDTSGDDIDRVIVNVKAAAGVNSSVTGNYSLYFSSSYFGSSASTNRDSYLEYNLGTISNLQIAAQSNSTSGLNFNFSGAEKDWRLENRYTNGSLFAGSGSPAKSEIFSGSFPTASSDSTSESLQGSVDSAKIIAIDIPASSELKEDNSGKMTVHYDFPNTLKFQPVGADSYLSLAVQKADGYAPQAADNSEPDFSKPVYRDYSAENILLVKNNQTFTPASFAQNYGVVVLTLASDEGMSHGISSELQRWAMAPDSQASSVVEATLSSDPGYSGKGKWTSVYNHDLILESGIYSENLGAFSVVSLEEAPTNDPQQPGSVIFAVNSNGQFRIPASLTDSLLENGSAIMEGTATTNGELFISHLMGKTSKGTYNNTPINSIIDEQYIAISIDNKTFVSGDFTNKTYAIQGIEYSLEAGDRGPGVTVMRGTLSFGSNPNAPVAAIDNQDINLNNRLFSVRRGSENYSSTADPLAAEFGENSALKLTDSETTLDGYISADQKLILLRILSAGDSDYASHGFIIGRLVE
ncbi:MAG: hypothetical protein LRY66_01640 [Saccharospirillaceae bacterium]|nr:hypothetical protein [Saccharospirillaceae bacterium]MCD8530070.1 hypothetical protein [Saccharospirillaceae bacterium]